jgi:Uma2 family endonuclease
MEAVAVAPKLPETLDELEDGEILRIPATWDEYLDLLETTPYTIQFLEDEIIIMGQATDTHELLVARLIKLFAIYFDDLDSGQRVLGSNVKIVIPNQTGDFNADLSVVRGKSVYGLTPGGRVSRVRIQNPEIVVEILSKGTRKFDLDEKLTAYQTIPSLQHIVFIDQQTVSGTVYSRTDQPGQWLMTHRDGLTDTLPIGNFALSLADVYRKIELGV